MSKIFDAVSDSEPEIQTDNEYAKNYDNWRKKEELNRLKTKYGEDALEEGSSSSSSDDEDGAELTEEVEKQFFKTLSCLKNKDPRIYDESVTFFDSREKVEAGKKAKKKKEKPMYIGDYERELILKKHGELSDDDDGEDDDNPRARSPTYVEEQKKLKESLKKALGEVAEEDDDDDDDWGGVLKVRHKTQEEKLKEEAAYKKWLAGQKDQIDDKEVEAELKPLKDYWNNPDLDEGEKFLKDYILKKRFLSNEDDDYIPTYQEIIHDSDKDLSEDEQAIEKQEEFEHKYNFRFEEPDQDFIKRYPRAMEHSLRKTDDRRKIKRAETKDRKQKEKDQKMQDLRKLQELKRKEIEEKIEKLREITGNDDMKFEDEDLEGDFDPEAHDKKMQSLFNEEFYDGNEGDDKPVFPEIDEFLELENWEKYEGEGKEGTEENEDRSGHCEDEDFNMDCDYDPQTSTKNELIENSKGRKKRKRKSLFAKAVSKPKPVFDPKDNTYEEYLDEYYKLDCEDIVGDMPCRFKYRKVVPNDFGLSVEEILTAKDRELNKWCSLKKALQHRPDDVEKYDQVAYVKKAANLDLKRRILPSLFESDKNEEVHKSEKVEEVRDGKKKKKMKKVRCKKGVVGIERRNEEQEDESEKVEQNVTEVEETKVEASGNGNVENKKKKKKKKKKKQAQSNESTSGAGNTVENEKLSKKRKFSGSANGEVANKKAKKDFRNNQKKQDVGISDARLSAYGLNPKKFKNKLKYGKS